MKKILISTIVIIGIVTYAVGNIAYSFFAVDLDLSNTLKIGTMFTGDFTPVFTATSEGNITLDVTTADMLMTTTSTPAATKNGEINVSLEGVYDKDNSDATCTFDFVYEELTTNGYVKYVPSPGVTQNNLKEFTVKIIDTNNNIVVEEKSIASLTSGGTIASGLSITSKGAIATKKYIVTATIYNLNISQNITNKKYGFKIKTTNVNCRVIK